jgi:tetratricopeptide (TPR) repeat protein
MGRAPRFESAVPGRDGTFPPRPFIAPRKCEVATLFLSKSTPARFFFEIGSSSNTAPEPPSDLVPPGVPGAGNGAAQGDPLVRGEAHPTPTTQFFPARSPPRTRRGTRRAVRFSAKSRPAGLFVCLFALAFALGACSSAPVAPARVTLDSLRGADSSDGEQLGRLLAGEMMLPGGDPARARKARERLDALGKTSAPASRGLFASLGRLLDDEAHGRFKAAALAALDALKAAHSSDHPDAPLVAWYAVSELDNLRRSVAGLWDLAKPTVVPLMADPGNIGWRARGDLVEWWSVDGYDPTKETTKEGQEGGAIEAAARTLGCLRSARLAGPFGHLAATDNRTRFDAEKPGPWPIVFEKDPARTSSAPKIVKVERHGCSIRPSESVETGIYYVETFVDLPAERDVILAVQAALAVLVDDTEVLTRDTRQWGIWPRFGSRLRLSAGRHRILARVGGPETAIRLMTPQGLPLDVPSSDDPTPPYSLVAPVVLPDPNPLAPFLSAVGVPAQKGAPAGPGTVDTQDPISRYLAAYLAHVESQDDVASVLFEPLASLPLPAKDAKEPQPTGPALSVLAAFVERDPIFPHGEARDRVKEIRERAADKDPDLWWPQMWLVLDEAEKSGIPEATQKMSTLAERFSEVPDFSRNLAAMYGELGWRAERARTLKAAAARFPDDLDLLPDLLSLYEDEGDLKKADEIAAHIQKLDPDAEIDLDRALRRRDYKAAVEELKKLGNRRKDRRDIALRIADLLVRSGQNSETIDKLERAQAKKPEDASARLALADARFAAGDGAAIRKAIVDAIQAGADPTALRDAAELLDGMNELSPYRIDGKKVIAEYEASGKTMPGTAARLLDYAALWVHPDGSARMLEHEIICVQSREAIAELSEQQLRGLALKARTIKHDGTVYEPEIVPGKPTVTMPHLEVGDYIETEMITNLRGDGRGGRTFEGPRWLFREEKVPYFRSEFIVVSPRSRPLDIETGGPVPAPQVTESGALVIRRWRVDKSPALPEEPGSAPLSEFLPNVRIGWGINLNDTLARLIDATSDETPRDPRLAKRANEIAADAGDADESPKPAKAGKGDKDGKDDKSDAKAAVSAEPSASAAAQIAPPEKAEAPGRITSEEKARRVYRWVVTNIEPTRENDPRRSVMGKSGNRTEAFLYLCRLLGIEASLGVVRDRLAPPPLGPMSEAETFGQLAVRIKTDAGVRWLVVRDKFAPFGYLPSGMRGQPAVVLTPGAPRETTPTAGSKDGLTNAGVAKLAEDGSATIQLTQRYEGQLAIGLRNLLESLPEAQVQETVESRLLPRALPGALIDSLEVRHLHDLDAPLTLEMKVRMPNFAKIRAGAGGPELVVSPPFALRLSGLATLPARETPLYISEQISTLAIVDLRVVLPEGARVVTKLSAYNAEDGGRSVKVNDRTENGALVIARTVDIPAGRVQPEAYATFQSFVREADTVLHRDVVIALK